METKYIGIDVHKEFSEVCVMDSEGSVMEESRVDSSPKAYNDFFAKYAGSSCVIESTGFWEYLYDALEECGIHTVLSNPQKTKAISEAKLKTDKMDARMLAHLLRANLIAGSYVPSKEIRELRDLVRQRAGLVCDATKAKNRIHHELLKRGIRTKVSFTKREIEILISLNIHSINVELDILHSIKAKIKEYDKLIEEKADAYEETRLLSTIPGIGKYSALLIFSEIVDIKRFPNGKKLASYVGLVPTFRQSGNSARYDRISKQGSRIMRWCLVECTHAHLRFCRNSVISKFYNRVYRRKGGKKATVAAARKLIDVIYSVLSNRREFYVHRPIPGFKHVAKSTGQ